MQYVIRVFTGAAAIWIGLLFCGEAYESLSVPEQPERRDGPPHIQAVRELADLTVLEVEVSDIATGTVNGRTGGTTAVMLIRGTAAIGVDLEQAYFASVDEEQQHVVLALSHPEVRQIALNPQTSRMLSSERTGLWQIAPGEALEGRAITQALAHGEHRLMEVASDESLHNRARLHAESVLCRFLREMGWTMEVRWE